MWSLSIDAELILYRQIVIIKNSFVLSKTAGKDQILQELQKLWKRQHQKELVWKLSDIKQQKNTNTF